MIDLPFHVIPSCLTPADLAIVRAGLAQVEAQASTLSGLADQHVVGLARRSARLTPPPDIETLLRDRILAARQALAAHFDRPLGDLEPLQVLRYGPGDYFVPHQDGNTPLIHDDTRHRRVSVSLILSDAADWTGGELAFHGPNEWSAVETQAGSLIAFASEQTHEVTVLESGERLSVAGWFRAPGL